MVKKWLDSIEKQRRRIDLKERYRQTDRQTDRHTYIHTDRQTESTTKNSRLLAGAESITAATIMAASTWQRTYRMIN